MNGWHLDKRVPITIIMALILQTVGIIAGGAFYAGATNQRLSAIEDWMRARPATLPIDLDRRLATVEANQIAIQAQLNRIERNQDGRREAGPR